MLLYVNDSFSIGEEGDVLCIVISHEGCRDGLFPVVDEDFCTVLVQNNVKLQLTVHFLGLTSSLVDEGSSGTGELSVNLKDFLLWSEEQVSLTSKALYKGLVDLLTQCHSNHEKCRIDIISTNADESKAIYGVSPSSCCRYKSCINKGNRITTTGF